MKISRKEPATLIGAALLISPLLLVLCTPAIGEVLEWTYDYSSSFGDWRGDGSGDDGARFIEPIADGKFILTGYVSHDDEWDLFVLKIDSRGDVEDDYVYDGTCTELDAINDYGRCIRETSDGGYIVVGVANSTNQSDDAGGDTLIIKLDQNLDQQWIEVFDEFKGGASYVIEVEPDRYVISGQRQVQGATKKHGMLMKITDNGSSRTVDWNNAWWPVDYTRDRWVSWFSACQQTDNGFICVGGGYRHIEPLVGGYSSIYLVFTDSVGNLLSKQLVSDPDNNGVDKEYEGRHVCVQVDDGFVITGCTNPLGGRKDGFMWRIPETWSGLPDGEWYQEYGDCFHSTSEQHDFGLKVCSYEMNGATHYAMVGHTVRQHSARKGSRDIWLVRADGSAGGTGIGSCAFGNIGADRGYSVAVVPNGEVIDIFTAGYKTTSPNNLDIHVLKTDAGPENDECDDCS